MSRPVVKVFVLFFVELLKQFGFAEQIQEFFGQPRLCFNFYFFFGIIF